MYIMHDKETICNNSHVCKCSWLQHHATYLYCMSKKQWPIIYSNLLKTWVTTSRTYSTIKKNEICDFLSIWTNALNRANDRFHSQLLLFYGAARIFVVNQKFIYTFFFFFFFFNRHLRKKFKMCFFKWKKVDKLKQSWRNIAI